MGEFFESMGIALFAIGAVVGFVYGFVHILIEYGVGYAILYIVGLGMLSYIIGKIIED